MRKSWLLNLALTLGSLAAALGVTELSVRLIAPQPTGLSYQDPYGLALHYPGLTRYLPQFGHEVSFNSVGLRDREHTLAKPDSVFRVLVLGDSFMEGLQVPFDSCFSHLLEEGLHASTGRPIEVINAGVGGWGQEDELRYLTHYGLAYRPDLVVVVLTLHNDVSDNLRHEWYAVEGGRLTARPRPMIDAWQYRILRTKAYLASRFQLYQLWRRVRHGGEIRQVGRALNQHVVQLFTSPPPPRIQDGLKTTELLLAGIRDSAATIGSKTAVVLLPLRYQLSDSAFQGLTRQAEGSGASMRVQQPQEMLHAIADSLHLPVVDLLPEFRRWVTDGRPSPYVEWDGHWNATGHRIAAGEATRGLVATGLIQ